MFSRRLFEDLVQREAAMSVGIFVVYGGAYIFLVFFAVCLATGLYYLAELVEEYTSLTRRIIGYIIKGIIALHVLLLIVDRLPFFCIACGLGTHLLYHRLLKTFPYINLTSYDFLGSLGGLLVSVVAWARFFLRDPRCAFVTIEWIVGFTLVMVWLVPFAFFISLAANDSVLPFGSGGPYQGYVRSDADPSHMRGGRRSRGALLSIMNFLKLKRDEVLPRFASKLPAGYHGQRAKAF